MYGRRADPDEVTPTIRRKLQPRIALRAALQSLHDAIEVGNAHQVPMMDGNSSDPDDPIRHTVIRWVNGSRSQVNDPHR